MYMYIYSSLAERWTTRQTAFDTIGETRTAFDANCIGDIPRIRERGGAGGRGVRRARIPGYAKRGDARSHNAASPPFVVNPSRDTSATTRRVATHRLPLCVTSAPGTEYARGQRDD